MVLVISASLPRNVVSMIRLVGNIVPRFERCRSERARPDVHPFGVDPDHSMRGWVEARGKNGRIVVLASNEKSSVKKCPGQVGPLQSRRSQKIVKRNIRSTQICSPEARLFQVRSIQFGVPKYCSFAIRSEGV